MGFYNKILQELEKSGLFYFTSGDILSILFITIPLSLFIYLLLSKYRHWMLVDVADHKWIIK